LKKHLKLAVGEIASELRTKSKLYRNSFRRVRNHQRRTHSFGNEIATLKAMLEKLESIERYPESAKYNTPQKLDRDISAC